MAAEGDAGGLAVPIHTPAGPYGILYLGQGRPHQPSPHAIAFIQVLADQAGVAIDRAQEHAEAQWQASKTEALDEVGRALSGTLERDQVLQLIVQSAQRLWCGWCRKLGGDRRSGPGD